LISFIWLLNLPSGAPGKSEVSSVIYKVSECMQELIKLWTEYEASQSDKNSESSHKGPTLEIRIPAEHITATNRQVSLLLYVIVDAFACFHHIIYFFSHVSFFLSFLMCS
jgi:hypothetical protein